MQEENLPAGQPFGEFELELSEDQVAILQDLSEEELSDEIEGMFAKASINLEQELLTDMEGVLTANREHRAGFEMRLSEHWKEALDLYEFILITTQEAGQAFNATHRPEAAASRDVKFDALTRLHARARLIASEIHALLTSGHADGAHTRWRTLHEIAVVAALISDQPDEVAERYLLHDAIQAARGAEIYPTYQDRISENPISDQELNEHRVRRAQLIVRFGKGYESEYGWAAVALGKKEPKFDQIERFVGLDHIRPYYRMASIGVHSSARGINFSLAADHSRMLLAGPSDGGLADPGHHALISLLQCTIYLINLRPSLEQATLLPALQRLTNQAGDAFLAAHHEWEHQMRENLAQEQATPPDSHNS